MPDVPGAPYEPYFTAQPTERPVPEPGISAVPAAFGEAVARATQTFGGEVDKAGNEVFSRALALRRLDIETKVRDRTTQLSNDLAPVMADYLSAQGANANQDVLNQHLAKMEQMRQSARTDVAQYGIYGQKMFDDEYSSMQRSFIRESANHAAAEHRKWVDGNADATLGAAEDRVRNAPNSTAFDDEIKNLPAAISTKAAVNGWGQQQSDRALGIATSKLVVARAEGLARIGDYKGAWKFFQDHDSQVLGEDDRDRVTKIIQDAENHRGANDIGQATSRGFAPYTTRQEADRTNGVSAPMLEVFKRAQRKLMDQGIEITIGDHGGVRTPAEQHALVEAGRSKTEDSDHLTGRAMDVVLRGKDGRPDYKDTSKLKAIDQAMRESADELNVPLQKQISWDQFHFGLTRDYDVAAAPKFQEESTKSKIDRATSWAEKQYGDHNPYIGQYVTANIVQNDDLKIRADRETDFRSRQTLTNALLGLNSPDQKPAMTLDQLFANGGTAATQAWQDADPTVKQAIMDKMSRVAKGENIQWSAKGLARYQELLHMEDFDTNNFIMNNMLSEEGIPTRFIVDLMKRQERALTKREADPRVGAVADYLEKHYSDEMSAMTSDQKKRYYGAVKSAVEEYNTLWGHAPRSPDDFENIHKFASSTVRGPRGGLLGLFGGSTEYNVWDQMPPNVLQQYQDQYPHETDDQLMIRYQKDQAAIMYNSLYSKPSGIGHA